MFWKILLGVYIFFCVGSLSGFLKAISYSKRYAEERIQEGRHWSKRANRMKNTPCSFFALAFAVLCPIVNVIYFFITALCGDAFYDALERNVDQALVDNVEEDF